MSKGERQNNLLELLQIEEVPLPDKPTDFWAGSIDKVEIMRRRIEAGVHLHHPYDCEHVMKNARVCANVGIHIDR